MINRFNNTFGKAKGTWVKVSVRSLFHQLRCTPQISRAWKSEYSEILHSYLNFFRQRLWFLKPAPQHRQQGCHKTSVFTWHKKKEKEKKNRYYRSGDRTRQRTGSSRPIHCWPNVTSRQSRYFGCILQGPRRTGTTAVCNTVRQVHTD